MRALRADLLLLCALAMPAQAGTFAHAVMANLRVLNLYDTLCTPILPEPSWQAEMLAPDGELLWAGCWRPMGHAVHIIWADTDQSLVQQRAFKPGPKPRT